MVCDFGLPKQQSLIKELNTKIQAKFEFLNKIDKKKFQMNPTDAVHWTKETPDQILEHWLRQLNM